MDSDNVYTALAGDTIWIKVTGRGTFQNSHYIKKYLLEKIEVGCPAIAFDLGECVGMDSTFMGVITGLSIRMQGLGRGFVTAVNISAHNTRLLDTLGLNRFLDIKENHEVDGSLIWQALSVESPDKIAVTKHMLDAHKQLIDTGGLAKEQFKNVHNLLQEDLERQLKKD